MYANGGSPFSLWTAVLAWTDLGDDLWRVCRVAARAFDRCGKIFKSDRFIPQPPAIRAFIRWPSRRNEASTQAIYKYLHFWRINEPAPMTCGPVDVLWTRSIISLGSTSRAVCCRNSSRRNANWLVWRVERVTSCVRWVIGVPFCLKFTEFVRGDGVPESVGGSHGECASDVVENPLPKALIFW